MLSLRDQYFAQCAYEEAEKSSLIMKHGCVGVANGKVLARAYNNERCYSKDGFINSGCTCHAEMGVLRKLFYSHTNTYGKYSPHLKVSQSKKLYKKLTLYVVRRGRLDDIRNSAPCIHCHKMISQLNIKRIVYSNDDGNFISCKPRDYFTTRITSGNSYLLSRNSR